MQKNTSSLEGEEAKDAEEGTDKQRNNDETNDPTTQDTPKPTVTEVAGISAGNLVHFCLGFIFSRFFLVSW